MGKPVAPEPSEKEKARLRLPKDLEERLGDWNGCSGKTGKIQPELHMWLAVPLPA